MTTANTTYNPIEGPFDTPPMTAPGRVLVIATASGFTLQSSGAKSVAPAQSLPPPAPFGQPKPVNETVAELGGELFRGSKKLFGLAQSTPFGRKYLGGKSRGYYLVNIGRTKIVTNLVLPSKEGTMHFLVAVQCDARVTDPIGVITDGLTDVCRYLETEFTRLLVQTTMSFSVQDLSEVSRALQAVVDTKISIPDFDRLIGLERGLATVKLDEEAHIWLRAKQQASLEIEAVGARGEVERARRDVQKVTADSPRELMAAWLATNDPRYKQALDEMLQNQHQDVHEKIEILKAMMDRGAIEPADLHARFPEFVDRVLAPILPGTSQPAPRTIEAETPSADKPAKLEIRLPD